MSVDFEAQKPHTANSKQKRHGSANLTKTRTARRLKIFQVSLFFCQSEMIPLPLEHELVFVSLTCARVRRARLHLHVAPGAVGAAMLRRRRRALPVLHAVSAPARRGARQPAHPLAPPAVNYHVQCKHVG